MATAREESGFGTGGKLRKRPFKRTTQATPYDRPSTILRNHNPQNGWLSKLVDPAQKLITAGANRLFASVFRKRLPPPPLQPEANHEGPVINQDSVSTDHPSIQGAINNHDDSHNVSDSGLSELEQILKQKTYTRSEIDRLTALLHSRTSDMLVLDDEQKRRETVPSSLLISHERVHTSLTTPIKENGSGNQQISMPVVNSSALDEDVASPAELAKAFMENRPHKLCPSQLVPRSQVLREESTLLGNRLFSVASPSMSLVPRPSGQFGLAENGFVTPRSKGRTAIYNMARTPYSRLSSTAALKGAGSSFESVAGPSSSSHRGTQKRRSSVLEGDIGSVGPIRRIRQKPNLITSRTSTLGALGSLTAHATGGPDGVQLSSSIQKPLLLGENKDSNYPTTSYALVPLKSSETASRILQTLGELVSPPREKSSMRLSPSMLRGPALKSLENVDSSILSENIEDGNKLDGSAQTSLPDARDSTFQKWNEMVENGPTKFISSFDKLPPAMNGAMTDNINDDKAKAGNKISNSALMNSSVHSYPQKKSAFQMSAHEDYLELDDDDHSNGAKSSPLVEDRDKLSVGTDKKIAAAESNGVEGVSAVTDVSARTILPSKANNLQNDTGAVFSEKSYVFGFSAAPSPSIVPQPAVVSSNSNSVVNASTTFNFGGRDASSKESIDVPTTFNTSTADVDKTLHHTGVPSSAVTSELPTVKYGASFDPKPGTWTRPSSYAIDATDSKVPDSDKADKQFNHKDEAIFSTPETTSSSSIFSFGASANSSSLKNGSVASSSSLISSSLSPPAPITFTGQNLPPSSTTAASTVDSVPASETTTSVISPAAPMFKFGSSAVSPMATEAKKKDGSFGNSIGSPIGGTSAFTSTESNIFGSTASATTAGTGSNIFGGTSSAVTSTVSSMSVGVSPVVTSTGSGLFGSTPATIGTGSDIFGITTGASSAMTSQSLFSNPFTAGSAQASSTVNGILSSSQNIPVQFGSSATSSTFGLTGNPSFPSSGSFGASVSSAKPFSSSPAFGLNSASSMSEANSIPASSATTPSIFGSSWPAQKSLFGSTFSSSTPATFNFNASSSSANTNSTPVFGASSGGATSSSIFPFTSSTAATSSQPTFGNASSVSPFASAPTHNTDQTTAATSSQSIFGATGSVNPFASTQTNNNNDQITMEDSMAEDIVQSTPTVAAFGQQSVPPSSGFVFGSSAPPNPFQFSSQQNLVSPQNPFQASLDFNAGAGGSFSLGSSGGGDKSHRRIVKVNKGKGRRK